jgi:hypothetical protein
MSSLLAYDITGLNNPTEPFCTCRERKNQQQNIQDVKVNRIPQRVNSRHRATVARRGSIFPFSRTRFTAALRRLRRRNDVVLEITSCRCMCQAKHAALTMTVPDDNVYKRALKAVSGLGNMQQQPSIPGSGGPRVAHPRGEGSNDIDTNTKENAQSGEDVQTNGVVGVVSARIYETPAAPRRCARTPDSYSKHRSTYSECGEHTGKENELNDISKLTTGWRMKWE